MMLNNINVLITGTNKGIGNQLVKLFLKNNQNAIIFATSRQNQSIAQQRWKQIDSKNQVKCKYLDITSQESIFNLVQFFDKQKIKIDILINNAAVARYAKKDEFPDLQWAQQCIQTNVVGHINLTEKMLPFISNDAIIVNVSSLHAKLNWQPKQTQFRFSNPDLAKQDILNAVKQYLKEVQNKNMTNFCMNVYATSKMLLNAWSRFIVQKKWLKDKQKSICVTPGLCMTPMNQHRPKEDLATAFSAESGASKIYQTIFLPDLDSQIFYHRARKSNFDTCGEQLPWQ